MSAPAAPVRLSRLRRKIGSRLRESVTTKPPVTLHTTAPADRLRREGGPGVTALVAEAAVRALADHPSLNGWIADDALTTFAEVHLGVAVDTDAGLIVPVVRDAHLLDAAGLGARSRASPSAPAPRSSRPRTCSTAPSRSRRSARSASSSSRRSSTRRRWPCSASEQSARRRRSATALVVEEHHIHLSLTFDHAAVDGAPAARFLAAVVDRIPSQSPKESA